MATTSTSSIDPIELEWTATTALTVPARREPLIDPPALGAAIGCLIALLCALVTGAGFMGMGLPTVGVALVSIIAAGSGGWLLGPRVTRASGVADWVGITLGLAFLTMVFGAIGVAVLAGVAQRGTTTDGPAALLFGIVALSLLGMLFFGWIAVPILIVPAAIWSFAMWLLAGRR
jgi:hypothetical protein